ncbi:conserved hypothetical protein [Sphingomonas sp. YR710]|jgi:uncharacterized protein (TIGR02001 family)|uniref:TorF family putative porin n=1 Tax=Sphingomonas sp. YR710 TaxID=1882773 RepID=UPI0008852FA5|nr:TorF family putative porin [Sphingomonas sp. YR710]SDC74320.1 conserved hypothetical protein [Sphingomonas sp. YR710]
MRTSFIGLSALALAAAASPAFADAPAATPMFTLTGSAALVSDYRFRGISQSGKRIAPQASATLTHSSGAYISFWSSSIDDYVAAGADAELDLIAGYSTTIKGVTLDGGLLYYVYPSAAKGVNTDFLEIYGSAKSAFGPVTLKGGFAYDPKQKAIASPILGHSKDDNLYLYAEASGAIPNTPFGLTSHLGYSHGRSFLTAGLKDYLDWNLGATYTWKAATFGVSYVDTDAKKGQFVGNVPSKNVASAGVVASVTYAF